MGFFADPTDSHAHDIDTGRDRVGVETTAPSLAGTLAATGDAIIAAVTNTNTNINTSTDAAPAHVE